MLMIRSCGCTSDPRGQVGWEGVTTTLEIYLPPRSNCRLLHLAGDAASPSRRHGGVGTPPAVPGLVRLVEAPGRLLERAVGRSVVRAPAAAAVLRDPWRSAVLLLRRSVQGPVGVVEVRPGEGTEIGSSRQHDRVDVLV